MDNRSKLVKAVTGTFGIKSIMLGMTFISTVLLTNILGVEGFGIYTLAIAWVGILVVPAKLGVDLSAVRYCSVYKHNKDWSRLKGYMLWVGRNVAIASVSVAILAAIIGLTLLRWDLALPSDSAYLLALCLIPLLSLLQSNFGVLRGLGSVFVAQLTEVLRSLLFLCFVVVLVLLGFEFEVQTAMLMALFSALISLAIGMWFLKKRVPEEVVTSKVEYEGKKWWASSITLAMSSGVNVLNNRVDVIILGFVAGPAAAGIYAVAKRSVDIVSLVLASTNLVVGPGFAKNYSSGEYKEIAILGKKMAWATSLVMLLLAVLLIITGKWLLSLFGNGFEEGYWVMVILLVGQLINAMSGSVGMILNMSGHEKDTARGVALAAFSNVFLCLILVPTYGLIGAAFASLLAIFIWNMTLLYILTRRTGINPSIFGKYQEVS